MPDFWQPVKERTTQRETILFIPGVHRIDPSKLKELIAKGTEEIEAEAKAQGSKGTPRYTKANIALALRDIRRFKDRAMEHSGRPRYY